MKFHEMHAAQFSQLGRSLEPQMTLGDIVFLQFEVGDMTDDEITKIVEMMEQRHLPTDYQPSQNRQIIKLASMHAY